MEQNILTECSTDERAILHTLSLLWEPHGINDIYQLARRLVRAADGGRAFTQKMVTEILDTLRHKKIVQRSVHGSNQNQRYGIAEAFRLPLYDEVLTSFPPGKLTDALTHVIPTSHFRVLSYQKPALVRLLLLTQADPREIAHVRHEFCYFDNSSWHSILSRALLHHFNEKDYQRLLPSLQQQILETILIDASLLSSSKLLPAIEWVIDHFEQVRPGDTEHPIHPAFDSFAFYTIEVLLNMGRIEQARACMSDSDCGFNTAFEAYIQVQQGNWEQARSLFEQALKQRRKETGSSKYPLTPGLIGIYMIALLQQGDSKAMATVRKLALSEDGRKKVNPESEWGQWAYFIDIKKNIEPVSRFLCTDDRMKDDTLYGLWRVLLIAWLGVERLDTLNLGFRSRLRELMDQLDQKLQRLKFTALKALLDDARCCINQKEARPQSYLNNKAEAWQEMLQSLQELAPAGQADQQTDYRIIWQLDVSEYGMLLDIRPELQKKGKRGWNKPRGTSLTKLKSLPALPSRDIKVIEQTRPGHYNNQLELSLPKAIQALVGHPFVALEENPDQLVELVAATPEMEVIHKNGKVQLSINPPLRSSNQDLAYKYCFSSEHDFESVRRITLIQDSPQRVKLYYFNDAQYQAAKLLERPVPIPEKAKDMLQATIESLSAHFDMHADTVTAAREVPAETRLRAELSTLEDGLNCRLIAIPLGDNGPRLLPGKGRDSVTAMIDGVSTGTQRQLKQEQEHIERIEAALPVLQNYYFNQDSCEWQIPDAEAALTLVEVLPTLPEVIGLDWPKGKAVSVYSVDSSQMTVNVSSERDWFKLSGEARIDQGMVFQFEQLMNYATQNNSRFIAMKDGTYLALTQRLKEQLKTLQAVSEQKKHGTQISKLAVALTQDALEDFDLNTDQDFQEALKQLDTVQQKNYPVPSTLQADLRSYQQDGFIWASRLAESGFGACLADDMGLGKTLQSLALLLARAADGPALVVAPTSVCGNWQTEAERFAPSLNTHLYSESERDSIIQQADAFDVIIVSYNLLQIEKQQFCEKQWHTIITDEAQAIKNASAKRSQAVFELQGAFRLALSGTPVENRLAELWSIMRFVNPGLLGTLSRFNERFVTPIERNKDRDAMHILRRLIAPFLLRRTKAQVLDDLPARTEQIIHIEADSTEQAHYEALRRQATLEADEAIEKNKAGQAHMNILAQLTRLRRAACDPRIVTDSYPQNGCKIEAFIQLAQELADNGHKALVFSQFTDFLDMLKQALEDTDLSYQHLDGSTPAAERNKRVARFQAGDSDLFLISLKAGGFGLNLTAADYVIITDPWWNPAAEDQAMGRAHRMGQKRPVTVYRLVTKGTVEEQIVSLHHDKRALADSILSDGDTVATPSTDELLALIKG